MAESPYTCTCGWEGSEFSAHPHDNSAPPEPATLAECEHCQGRSNPDCRYHGIGASNARQDKYWRGVHFPKLYDKQGNSWKQVIQ